MRSTLVCLLVLFVTVGAASAQAPDARRMIDDAEAPAWRGVGRLNIAGRRFCTATLVSETLAVTAAHCLHHPRSGVRIRLTEMRFVAGLRLGTFAASRRIVRAAVPDDFVFAGRADPRTLRNDLALLELSEPVAPDKAAAFPVGSPLADYEALALVSYSRDRAHAPAIERPCRMRASMRRVAALDCAVTHGASGAPVFVERGGAITLSAVVSAMGRAPDGAPIALAVMARPMIDELKAKLSAAPYGRPPPEPRPERLH